MTVAALLPGVLGLAVAVAWARLVIRAVRTPATSRRPARLAVLLAAQPVVAGLLYLTLVPPRVASSGTLIVATRGTKIGAALTGDRLVALREAPALPGATRVPDLGTALRRFHPSRLRVVGDGLTARDRDAAPGLAIDFAPPPAPRGIVRLDPPPPVAAGNAFAVGGQVSGGGHAVVDLIDPAGRRVDTALPDAAGDFIVSGTTRAAGPAAFTLRVRDGTTFVESAAVPVWTAAAPPPRLLLIAGAPGPEVKYLRRWASDAGLAVHSEVATGAGLDLGDAAVPLTAATLARFDVAVFDTRSWSALSPATRAAVIGAVRGGLGLIVRLDGPPTDADRAALRPLGFGVTGGDDTAPVVLAAPADDAVRLARRGPGTRDDPASVNRGEGAPGVTRWNATITAPDATPLLRDVTGAPIALWRAAGAGRIALWPLADSYKLVLAGDGDRYAELWSAAFAMVGRARGGRSPVLDRLARVGERAALCGLGGNPAVVAPDGRTTRLLADPPGSGCAAFWPRVAGWHRAGPGDAPFFVSPAGTLPNARAAADTQATLALAAARPVAASGLSATQPGSSWPWFLGWLAASAALWWFERARRPVAGEDEQRA